MLDILEDYLELRSLVYSRLDGTMSFTEREKQMTMFRESPDCHVFLLSTRAGGLGINLTNADTVIIYDSDWVRGCQNMCLYIVVSKILSHSLSFVWIWLRIFEVTLSPPESKDNMQILDSSHLGYFVRVRNTSVLWCRYRLSIMLRIVLPASSTHDKKRE